MSTRNLEQLRSELMVHHQNEITAHLEKDIEFFIKNVSDNYLSVSRGDIHYPTKEEIRDAARWLMTRESSEMYKHALKKLLSEIGFKDAAEEL